MHRTPPVLFSSTLPHAGFSLALQWSCQETRLSHVSWVNIVPSSGHNPCSIYWCIPYHTLVTTVCTQIGSVVLYCAGAAHCCVGFVQGYTCTALHCLTGTDGQMSGTVLLGTVAWVGFWSMIMILSYCIIPTSRY